MKLRITILGLLSICLSSFGQGSINLSGQVKDEESGDPLEFCNVSYYNLNDSLITGVATDQKGFFSSDLPMGNYKQVISYIGNVSDTSVLYAYETKFLGIYSLKSDLHFLGEASVKASSRSSEIDRDVQVVTKEMKEGAFSAKYVLAKMNGVHYDEFNNAIKVDNDSRVIILVDGIEKDQDYVKNLSPDRLKKIEVIRDPSGRYGMEGYSAVINIILNKDYMGVEIFVQDRGLFDIDAVKKEYVPVQNGPGATVTYTYDKVSIYGKYSNNYANYNMNNFESKSYASGLKIEKIPTFEDDAGIKVKQKTNNYTIGADYFINPKHTLSYEGKLMALPEKANTVKLYQTVNNYQNDLLLSSNNTDIDVRSNSLNGYNSLFYEAKLDDKNNLKSNIVYSNYSNEQWVDTEGSSQDFAQQGSDQKYNINYYLEYDHGFKDNSNLMVGYGFTWESLSSKIDSEWQQNDFKTRERRNKFYTYYSKPFGSKTSVKIGGAGEASAREVEGRTDNYMVFLPHFDFKYDINKNFNVKLKVRADASYPNINQTNPFTTFVDFESVQTGNPNLMPEVTNRLSTQLTIFQAFTLEPYYHYSKNMIITTGSLRADSIFEYRYHNAGLYKNYGIKTNITLPIGKSIFFQSSLDLYNSSVEFEQYSNQINDWAMSSQLIYFHQKSKGIVGLIYQKNNNKKILAQGYRNQNVDFWSFLVRRPFLKEQLSVMLLYFIPVTWGIDLDQVTYLETDTYNEIETTSMDFFQNMIMLEVSYRFNKGKVIKKDKEVDYIREKENKSMF